MKRTWSDPNKAWNDFRRTKYYLNDRLLSLPLITATRETTTVGAFYKDFIRDSGVRELQVEETGLGGVEIGRPGMANLNLIGKPFSCKLLRLMIEFQKEGIQPFSTSWFWYDSDSAMQLPQEAYSFFVVFEDKIVRDRVVLFDDSDAGFDPDVFGDSIERRSVSLVRRPASAQFRREAKYEEYREAWHLLQEVTGCEQSHFSQNQGEVGQL